MTDYSEEVPRVLSFNPRGSSDPNGPLRVSRSNPSVFARRDNSMGNIIALFITNRVCELISIDMNAIFSNINDILILSLVSPSSTWGVSGLPQAAFAEKRHLCLRRVRFL